MGKFCGRKVDQNSNEETRNKQTNKKTTHPASKSGTETMNTHLFIYIKTEMSVECF